MNFDRVIAIRNNKTVYRDGDNCIKLFGSDFRKSDILNEALNQARVEETGLSIPHVRAVTVYDGKWAIVSDFIKGKTLSRRLQSLQRHNGGGRQRLRHRLVARHHRQRFGGRGAHISGVLA